jgi:hypothetical protein
VHPQKRTQNVNCIPSKMNPKWYANIFHELKSEQLQINAEEAMNGTTE